MHPWLAFDPQEARRVLVAFVRGFVADAGASGVVLGLSGGLDSAVVATVAAEALGPRHVHTFSMPGPTSAPEDGRLAALVAEGLGVPLSVVPVAAAAEALARDAAVPAEGPARANIQPRLRMTVLYAKARERGAVVAGTGNKSEVLTGYFTKHGDGGVDLQPLGDLYKTQVRALAETIGVPEEVRRRAPTAGLWPGQTDEGELGVDYGTLDIVLAGIERERGAAETAREARTDEATVERIARMVRGSWHKRALPPVPKLGYRTPGVDWREPVTSFSAGRAPPGR